MTQWSEEAEQSPESDSSRATAEACFCTADAPFSDTNSSSATAGADSTSAAAARRRGQGGLTPSADAVSMANTGCRAVPGMSPAEYREARYSTWMTGRPWGMQYMPADSDDEVSMTQISRRHTNSTTPHLWWKTIHAATFCRFINLALLLPDSVYCQADIQTVNS